MSDLSRFNDEKFPDTFEECIEHILRAEGGYVNDPADPGGETKYGISKRAFPALDIKNITRQQAVEIYREYYWNRPGIEKLPPHLRLIVFDAAVNIGAQRAVQLLQRLAAVSADGIIGRITTSRAVLVTPAAYLAAREKYYREIAAQRPSSGKFLRGWLRRLRSLSRLLRPWA